MNSGKTIDHPGAWKGKQLFSSDFWNSDAPFTTLSDVVSEDKHQPSLLMQSSEFDGWFEKVRNELEDGSGAVLIRGLTVPKGDLENQKKAFLNFCSRVGTPISQSASGETVFSVRDEGYSEDDKRARGPNTRKKLSFHTDRCDVIAFLCLMNAKSGGENQVVSSMTLYNEMLQRRPDLVEVLLEPYFYQRHNVDLGNESPYTEQPIFSFYQGKFAANLLRVLIERAYASGEVPAMTEKQKEALDCLEEIAADPELHVTFRQEPGDILLLNNWVTLHRRTEFEDFPELEKRRHILRVWLSMPNSRELDPRFAGNYGSTKAGAIRGGMHPGKNKTAD